MFAFLDELDRIKHKFKKCLLDSRSSPPPTWRKYLFKDTFFLYFDGLPNLNLKFLKIPFLFEDEGKSHPAKKRGRPKKGFYCMMESGVEEIPPVRLPRGGENSSKEGGEKPEQNKLQKNAEATAAPVKKRAQLTEDPKENVDIKATVSCKNGCGAY